MGVIRRKLAAVQGAPPESGGADKAWPLALARAARDAMALRLEVEKLDIQRRSLTELLDMPPERALIAVLEGPAEGLGVLVISPSILAGLIEAQTVGQVSPRPEFARKPTRTDAAMVAGMLDLALEGMESLLVAEDDLVWAGGFRYASFLDDPRPLGLLLEDVPYRLVQAQISLAGGMKTGSLMLALPADGRGRKPRRPDAVAPQAGAALMFAAAMNEQVMAADCTLEAVLAKVTLPLAAVMKLKVGDVLPLGTAALDRIALTGITGQPVAVGRLGQNRGMRAVRVDTASDAAPRSRGGDHGTHHGLMAEPMAMADPDDLRLTGTG
ncbi:FliM/FliN family flagellar motor switch protein [Rhodobacter ferrooxidans]|uniref:Flagellar motor switch protein FliM n=1 Tax=Rhodobacter ferrooxidans TaxID=371731 RepID=C8S0N0_9RHOB|nr:FliM/FliN family flagellar motor switch protein [Rhodobacter sp. SW2]EEW25564.1 surface presentation of antigens (SPOA) protein [Rhodobacter sp. SW2]